MSTLDSLKMTDKNNNFFTRNWWNNALSIIKKAISDNKPYKVYTALLTQISTDAPTATVLQNTLGFEPTFSYEVVGQYQINSPILAGFKDISESKTTILFGQSNEVFVNNLGLISYELTNGDFIVINTRGYSPNAGSISSLTLQNDMLYKTMVEIRVYN
jgi:hypothetical protein